MKYKTITIAALALTSATALNAAELITEGGFEITPTSNSGVNNVLYPNWTGSQNVIETWHDGFSNPSNPSGTVNIYDSFAGDYHVELARNNPGYIYQTFTADASGSLEFSFAHGQRDDLGETLNFSIVEVNNGFDGLFNDTVADRFNLIAGGDDVVLFDQAYTTTGTPNVWTVNTGASTAVTAGQEYALVFSSGTPSNGIARGNFVDAVSANVIPEPSSTALLGLGGLALLARRRR